MTEQDKTNLKLDNIFAALSNISQALGDIDHALMALTESFQAAFCADDGDDECRCSGDCDHCDECDDELEALIKQLAEQTDDDCDDDLDDDDSCDDDDEDVDQDDDNSVSLSLFFSSANDLKDIIHDIATVKKAAKKVHPRKVEKK